MQFFDAWTKTLEDMLCIGYLGADREDAAKVIGQYHPQLREIRAHLDHGERDLWLLLARTVEGDIVLYTGPLAHVMGRVKKHNVIRITLLPLVIAAERVRMLVEKGEIEVDDDLPPPASSPTLVKIN
jgi:hypothetical protein